MSTLKVNTVLSADTPTVNVTDGLSVSGVSTFSGNVSGAEITAATSGVPIKVNSTNSNDFKIGLQNNGSTVSYLGGSSSNFFRVGNGSASSVLDVDSSSNLKFNSGYGSVATAYGCRAWANFNGTGTAALRGSGNLTSLSDLGTGRYTLSYSSNMPDANYAICTGLTGYQMSANDYRYPVHIDAYSTGSITFDAREVANGGSNVDPDNVWVAVFR